MSLEAPRSQYRQVADLLRVGIERGEYAAGSALPAESDLASRFGVSRVTINRAVQPVSYTHLTLPTKRIV